MKKLDEADLAITFSKVIRENQGWPIRASLTELESQLDEVYKESGSSRKTLPTTQKELAKTCRRIWEEAVTEDVEFKRGKVGNVFLTALSLLSILMTGVKEICKGQGPATRLP